MKKLLILTTLLINGCSRTTVPANLEGYYYLDDDSFIELVASYDNDVYIVGSQRLVTVNFDGGLALHPNLPSGPHEVTGNCVVGIYSPNYNTNNNDVEVDDLPSTNISGKHDTLFSMCLNKDDKLEVNIKIYSDNQPFELLVNRTLTEK